MGLKIDNKNPNNILIDGKSVVSLSINDKFVWNKYGIKDYLHVTAVESGLISILNYGTNATTTKPNIDYSRDGKNWITLDVKTISIDIGETVYFKGINNTIANKTEGYTTIRCTFKCHFGGNIMSLLYGDDFEDKLSLAGKTHCFYALFSSCTGMITAPKLPAIELGQNCYYYMFQKCTNLINPPKLPATELEQGCYSTMFRECTGMITAPELPAINLKRACYTSMFNGCTSIKTIYCNGYMLDNAVIRTNIGTTWLLDVPNSSDCIFYKNPKWIGPTVRDENTIPSEWTIKNWKI